MKWGLLYLRNNDYAKDLMQCPLKIPVRCQTALQTNCTIVSSALMERLL